MESEFTLLALPLFSVVSLAAVSMLMTRIAAQGTMGPSSTMGIRTRHTKASPEAWQAAHAAALPVLNWTGWLALLTIAVAVPLAVWAEGQGAIPVVLAGLLAQTVVLFRSAQVANRAARAVTAEQGHDGG